MSAQQGPGAWLLRSVGHSRPDPRDDAGQETAPEPEAATGAEREQGSDEAGEHTPDPPGQQTPQPKPEPDTPADDGTDDDQDWGTGDDPWKQFIESGDPGPAPHPQQAGHQDQSRPLSGPEPRTVPPTPDPERPQDDAAREPQPDTPADDDRDRFTQAEIDDDWTDQDDWETDQDDEGWGFDQDDQQTSQDQPNPQQDTATPPPDGPDTIWDDDPGKQDTQQSAAPTPPTPRPHNQPDEQDDATPDTMWPDDPDTPADDAHDYAIPQDDFGQAIASATDTPRKPPWKRIAAIAAAALAIAGLTAGAIHTGSAMIARHREQAQQARRDNALTDAQNAFTREQSRLKTQVDQVRNSPVAKDPSLKTPLAQAEAAASIPTPMNKRDITLARQTITMAADTLERAYKPLIDKSISQQQERLRSLISAADGLKDSPDGQARRSMMSEADGLRGTTVTRGNIRDVIRRLDRLDGDVGAVRKAKDDAAKAEEDRKAQSQRQPPAQQAPAPQTPSYTPRRRYSPGYGPAPRTSPAPAPAPAPAPTPAPAQPGGSVGIEG